MKSQILYEMIPVEKSLGVTVPGHNVVAQQTLAERQKQPKVF